LEARFVAGLRERGLLDLAESYCLDRLSRASRDSPARADLTVELIRMFASQAVNAPEDQREALWMKARGAATDFLQQSPEHPRAVRVRFEQALTLLAEGEAGRLEHEVAALPSVRLEAIQRILREAANLLETLERELNREIPLRRRAPPPPGGLEADELLSLQHHVAHQLARAHRTRALLFATTTDDRLALLLAAADTLTRLLAQLNEGEALRDVAQLDLAECQRLLGRHVEAEELLIGLKDDRTLPSLRLRAQAERIRIAIARNDLSVIRQLIDEPRAQSGHSSAELEFARLEALLTLARSASGGHQEQAIQTAKSLEQTFGPYWGRRADQLLAAMLPHAAVESQNVELIKRKADGLYLQGDVDGSVAAYESASSRARENGDLVLAFELAYKAALVEQQSARYLAAAERLRSIANTLAPSERAASVHLLAVWNAGQAADTEMAAQSLYRELLREHLAAWPASESAEQARQWLGKGGLLAINRERADQLVAKDQRAEALAIYSRLAEENPDSAALQKAYAELLLGSSDARELQQALRQWRIIASRSQPRTPPWYEAKYSVALAQYKLGDRASAATLLRYILQTAPGLTEIKWEAAYRELLSRCAD
jgi:hypothetical protein